MKKVLLASTVLALTAGVAAAEVTVSGEGRMGVAYNSEAVNELSFSSRVRVIFNMSGETDTGLAFGATIRADNSGAGNSGVLDANGEDNQTAGSIFVSGAFGRLTMGDVNGAAELVAGDLAAQTLTGLGDLHEFNYLSNNGNGRTAARYEYSTGGLTFAVSADNPGRDGFTTLGGAVANPGIRAQSNTYSVGVRYAVDGYAVGLGYETADFGTVSSDQTILMGQYAFGDYTIKALYGQIDNATLNEGVAVSSPAVGFNGGVTGSEVKQYGLSVAYAANGLGVTAYHRVLEQDSATLGSPKLKITGIGASYDLGGGASVVGGIADVNRSGALRDETRADLGLSLRF